MRGETTINTSAQPPRTRVVGPRCSLLFALARFGELQFVLLCWFLRYCACPVPLFRGSVRACTTWCLLALSALPVSAASRVSMAPSKWMVELARRYTVPPPPGCESRSPFRLDVAPRSHTIARPSVPRARYRCVLQGRASDFWREYFTRKEEEESQALQAPEGEQGNQ